METLSRRLPRPSKKAYWWVDSVTDYPRPHNDDSHALVWNPLIGLNEQVLASYETLVVDLLDDWTGHFAFSPISAELELAYSRLFDSAQTIFANSEATVELARRKGRDDVILMLNGCDPDRFSTEDRRSGESRVVGYVGKIGRRLDAHLIRETALLNENVEFVFAGPILDRQTGKLLSKIPNLRLIGDVHYRNVPSLLATFDIGWVPHGLGNSEVGGDVIKTYEYRAAGLPVLTTPVLGAGKRNLTNVVVLNRNEHADWVRRYFADGLRRPRILEDIPRDYTWQYKAEQILTEGFGIEA